jgi:hypothetical protein
MKRLYLVLAIAGFVLPYVFFVSFLAENGLDLPLLVEQLFANQISAFFALDLVITAVTFWVFLYHDAQAWEMGYLWVYVLSTLLVGPSFAVRLYLYVREKRIEIAIAAMPTRKGKEDTLV